MRPHEVLMELGGAATWAQLRLVCSRAEIGEAIASGGLVRVARGRYALRQTRDHALAVAAELNGSVAVLSAAQAHGWSTAREPDRPWVCVPRNRNLTDSQRARAHVVRGRVSGGRTSPLQTVMDCARRLPFGEALAVADSSLRSGDLTTDELRAAAAAAQGPGGRSCRRVAGAATPLAASPLESMLRALAMDVAGLTVVPQVPIELPGFTAHPDLVDTRLRIVLEADTWRYHAQNPEMFNRDLRRYTLLVAEDWLVARFGHHDVLHDPDHVRRVISALVGLREDWRI